MSLFSMNLESLEGRRLLSASPALSLGVGDGSNVAAPNFVVNTPKPTEGGRTFTEIAKEKFTAKLGEFTYRTVDQALNAVIKWGDGTHSEGKLVGSYATGEYYVQGTHTYAHTGTYKVDVTVFASVIGSPVHPTNAIAGFTSVIKTKSLKPSDGGLSLTETAGKKFNDRLGEFTFKTVDQLLNAAINWGDGTHSDGKLVGSYATGKYYVMGKHTYAHAGTYKVDVKIFAHLAGNPNVKPTGSVAAFTSVIKVAKPV